MLEGHWKPRILDSEYPKTFSYRSDIGFQLNGLPEDFWVDGQL